MLNNNLQKPASASTPITLQEEDWQRIKRVHGSKRVSDISALLQKHAQTLTDIGVTAAHVRVLTIAYHGYATFQYLCLNPTKISATKLSIDQIVALAKANRPRTITKYIIENQREITDAGLKETPGTEIDYIYKLAILGYNRKLIQNIITNAERIKDAKFTSYICKFANLRNSGKVMTLILENLDGIERNGIQYQDLYNQLQKAAPPLLPHLKRILATARVHIKENMRVKRKCNMTSLHQELTAHFLPLRKRQRTQLPHTQTMTNNKANEYWTKLWGSHDEIKSYVKSELATWEKANNSMTDIRLYDWRWDLASPQCYLKLKDYIFNDNVPQKNIRLGIIIFSNNHYTSLVIKTTILASPDHSSIDTQLSATYMDSLGQRSNDATRKIIDILTQKIFPHIQIQFTNQSRTQQMTTSDCAYFAAQNMFDMLTEQRPLPPYHHSPNNHTKAVIAIRQKLLLYRRTSNIHLWLESLIRRLAEMQSFIECGNRRQLFKEYRATLAAQFPDNTEQDITHLKAHGIQVLEQQYLKAREHYFQKLYPPKPSTHSNTGRFFRPPPKPKLHRQPTNTYIPQSDYYNPSFRPTVHPYHQQQTTNTYAPQSYYYNPSFRPTVHPYHQQKTTNRRNINLDSSFFAPPPEPTSSASSSSTPLPIHPHWSKLR